MSVWAIVLAAAIGLWVSLAGPAAGMERMPSGRPLRRGHVRVATVRRVRRRPPDPGVAARVGELWSADLEAGRPTGRALADALEAVAGHDPSLAELRRAAAGIRLGDDPAAALRRCGVLGDDGTAWAALAACWTLGLRGGGRIADAVAQVAAGLRLDVDLRQELRAQASGATSAVRLVAALPLLGPVIGSVVGADPIGILVQPPLGPALLLLAGILNGIGLVWVRRLMRSAVAA